MGQGSGDGPRPAGRLRAEGPRPEDPVRGAGPVRTCAGCRSSASASELVRVVLAADGELVPGRPGGGGRGAWLCRDSPACFDAAARGGFARSFRTTIDRRRTDALRAIMDGRARMEVHPHLPGPTSGEVTSDNEQRLLISRDS